MSQSLAKIYLHIVFSTKNRLPLLHDGTTRERIHAYIQRICQNLDTECLIIGGVADHLHILCVAGKSIAPADLIKEIKRVSTTWIKRTFHDLRTFAWQTGYGVFSVSPSHLPAVTQYIRKQEHHHQQVTFQDEFRKLLTKYRVKFDEQYVWG